MALSLEVVLKSLKKTAAKYWIKKYVVVWITTHVTFLFCAPKGNKPLMFKGKKPQHINMLEYLLGTNTPFTAPIKLQLCLLVWCQHGPRLNQRWSSHRCIESPSDWGRCADGGGTCHRNSCLNLLLTAGSIVDAVAQLWARSVTLFVTHQTVNRWRSHLLRLLRSGCYSCGSEDPGT